MDRSSRPHRRRLSPPADLSHPVVAELLARCSFPPPGSAVTCAVSGGPDSLSLLVLAVASGCRAVAVHVDHGVRSGSHVEADLVAEVAAWLGAEFRAERVRVDDGPNLEARLRSARLGALPSDVLTGHTADDRAETVLLHLMRGAGPAGAVGIARSPRRPLLDLRRADTEALCAVLGLEPFDDPTNAERRFARNRVRHEVLPLLADIADRDPVPILVRQADLFADLDALVGRLAAELDAASARALAEAPRPVAGAAIRAWLVEAGVGDGYGVDAAAVDRILEVAAGTCVATEVDGGWRVARSGGRLTVSPPATWKDADHG